MYKIDVKKVDIKLGKQEAHQECAIARAVLRAGFEFPLFDDGVFDSWIEARSPEGERVNYHLPKKAKAFIKRFDADKTKCKPFSFTIR